MIESVWTTERVESLKSLWEQRFSASKIATKLGNGISRSAVLGKVHRLELPTHKVDPKPKKPPTPRPIPKRPRFSLSKNPEAMKPVAAAIPSLNLCLFDLTAQSCRFPTTDDKPFLFCGHPKAGDSPYCPHHHAVCHAVEHPRSPSTGTTRAIRKYLGLTKFTLTDFIEENQDRSVA